MISDEDKKFNGIFRKLAKLYRGKSILVIIADKQNPHEDYSVSHTGAAGYGDFLGILKRVKRNDDAERKRGYPLNE